jgi:hypothetical protein
MVPLESGEAPPESNAEKKLLTKCNNIINLKINCLQIKRMLLR